jgi:hypothetical protein
MHPVHATIGAYLGFPAPCILIFCMNDKKYYAKTVYENDENHPFWGTGYVASPKYYETSRQNPEKHKENMNLARLASNPFPNDTAVDFIKAQELCLDLIDKHFPDFYEKLDLKKNKDPSFLSLYQKIKRPVKNKSIIVMDGLNIEISYLCEFYHIKTSQHFLLISIKKNI